MRALRGRLLTGLILLSASPPLMLARPAAAQIAAAPSVTAQPAEREETLADALDDAYHSAPQLQAQRYTLRASDEDYAQALAETRLSTEIRVSGTYNKTVPGETTQATRIFPTSPIITSNTLAATATATQPILTGGKASADRSAALAEIRAGRAQLRATEGDLLLSVLTSYADILRDTEAVKLREANLDQLRSTLDEVGARREAGQLTRTDAGLARQQLYLAQALQVTTDQQLEVERATYSSLVGHDPGHLAPLPQLPGVPSTIDEAFRYAEELNPDMAQAIAQEGRSRATIASAAAQGRPSLALSGSATLTGSGVPYYFRNQDQQFVGQMVLTIPLTNGGRVGSAVAQAQDRNSADRIGIEYARRLMVEQIVNAWNAVVANQRSISIQTQQVEAAQIYDEGTYAEYREGLRSTFDALYAHGVLRDAEIARQGAVHDLYVAQATLLRRIGLLEVRSLLTGTGLYNPDLNLRKAELRGATPIDAVFAGADNLIAPGAAQHRLRQPPNGKGPTGIAPAAPDPGALPWVRSSSGTPLPGTTGTPMPRSSGAQ